MGAENTIAASKTIALANWSWRVFLAGLLLMALASFENFSTAVRLAVTVVILTTHLSGVVMATMALCGVRKHGRKGILVPAVVGLILNTAILLLAIAAVLVLFAAFRAAYA